MFLLFFCLDAKEKVTKEKIKAALFWLLRHFSPLNKKNSLRSNSEAHLSPPLEDRPLVEEREEFFALSREEEKDV